MSTSKDKPDDEFDSTAVKMAQVDKLCSALEHKDELIRFVKKQMNIKTVKPRVKVPSIQDIIAHTRNSEISTKKYFTTGRQIKQIRDVAAEPSPFDASSCENFLTDISFKPPKVVKTRMNHSYMFDYQKSDILDRLYIPDTDEIPPAKTDNNSEYFTLVKGRPIREKFDKRHFAVNHRRCFFKKLCAGFLEDEIKKQEEHHIRDLWQMFTIREELDKIIQSFENYLSDDHQEAVKIIEESQQIAHLKDQKMQEVKLSRGYLNAIKCSLYRMDEELAYRKYCKEAIYKISPTQWQEDFEKSKEMYKPKAQAMAEELYDHYQEFLAYNPEEDKHLDKLVNDLFNDILNLGPPSIYFQHPWEVDLVFKEFELQNLHAAKHLSDVKNIQKDLNILLKHVKEYYTIEIGCLQEKIKDLEAGILYQKDRSLELEAIAKELTQTVFKDVVSADHILETQALVKNMFDEIIGDEDTKLSYVEMMEKVETEIVDVWNKAHEIPRFKYQEYEMKVWNKTREERTAALDAKRREKTIVLTVDRLHRSYIRQGRTMFKKLVPRSDPPPLIKRFERMKLKRKLKEDKKKKQISKTEIKEDKRMKSRATLTSDEMTEEESKIDLPKLVSSSEVEVEEKTGPRIISMPIEEEEESKYEQPRQVWAPVEPKIATNDLSIAEIVEKFKEIEESIALHKLQTKMTEQPETLPFFKGYKFDFDRIYALHESLLDEFKKFGSYRSSEFQDEVELEEIFLKVEEAISLKSFSKDSTLSSSVVPSGRPSTRPSTAPMTRPQSIVAIDDIQALMTANMQHSFNNKDENDE